MLAWKTLTRCNAIQSGATLRSGSRDAANRTAEQVLTQLDLGRDRFRDLQRLPLETLLAVQGRFGPFLDGAVVPSHPFDPTAPELSAHVPVIVGTDLHDISFTRQDFDLDEALTTLAEVSAAQAVGAPVVPASVTVNLLRRARPGRLVGRGTVVRKGRRLAVAEGEVTREGELVAKAVVTFAVLG